MDESFEPAVVAIYTGDLTTLGQLLADDPELVGRESSIGHPTLLQLVAGEEPDIVDPVGAARLLVEAGAPTSDPLITAAGTDARSVLNYLLDAGAPVDGEHDWTPLDEALYWNREEVTTLLIDRGAEVRTLRTAAGLGDVELLDRFFDGDDPTEEAGPIRSPFAETVPESLADDPAAIIDNAFVMAVNNRRREAAEYLLGRSARVNEPPPGYHWKGTALHAAAWRGDRILIEWLLSIGADPAIRDGLVDADVAGWARHHGHPELVELLA